MCQPGSRPHLQRVWPLVDGVTHQDHRVVPLAVPHFGKQLPQLHHAAVHVSDDDQPALSANTGLVQRRVDRPREQQPCALQRGVYSSVQLGHSHSQSAARGTPTVV